MSNLSNEDFQIKLAFLERHLEEQDKTIYAMRGEIDKLQRKIVHLENRLEESNRSDSDEFSADERPPHY
ncbi:SlyX family protein [Pelagicoccus sp. SDUM812003]|uniref:SlyX family protein n=1 Tax=Pelagicoccus sp. SDUM812003 TaxID=3041267 RepID=UPI0028100223|nr:SlyX family protein [Pelagicoccus sp. SDUM812003]MDQ8202515.1 SlyX family protein [Pelagicoccus sp. SDUM812003]